ncbi:MAG: CaiB/BaiF CoA transferase family protein [Alphaproteobacteria bacterium]
MSDPSPRPGPLNGIRVLDLSRVLAGPFSTMILADLGAEVIKIEEAGAGDQTRTIPPFVEGISHYFVAINRNKKSVVVDLKSPEGREVALALAEKSDIVIENFRGGVMKRLGLDYEALKARNPRVILCSLSGFGQTGSMATKPSFDLVSQALSGAMSINGEPDGPPTKLGLPMGDLAGGLWGAIGVLAALQHRQSNDEGLHIDLSLLEGLMGFFGYLSEIYLMTGEIPGRVGSSHHNVVPYGRFPVKDGHIVLAIHVGDFWRKFAHAIKRLDLIDDPRFKTTTDRRDNRDVLEAIICEILATKTRAQWQAILDAADVPHAPVNNVKEALEQTIIRERGFVTEVNQPPIGPLKMTETPLKFSGRFEDRVIHPAPGLGQHTRDVLAGLLEYSDQQIEHLFRANVVAEPDAQQTAAE